MNGMRDESAEALPGAGWPDLAEHTAQAAAALEGLRAPAERAAASIEAAFGRAGESLTRSLARAAADGEISLAELAQAVVTAVNAVAGESGAGGAAGTGPGGLGRAVAQVVGGLFGGTRADGGPVAAGAAYVVGERGPEVFRPMTAGTIETASVGGSPVTVNLSLGGGPQALLRSEAQIAQMLARAVSLGARRL